MKYTTLGNTDIQVSRICLGCMGFGEATSGMHSWTLGYEKSKEIIEYALSKGINFFDTAPAYQGGTSETFLGKAFKELNINRKDIVIATKFLPKSDDSISYEQYIYDSIEGSLNRLQTDYIDLYILHKFDDHYPIEKILIILNELIDSGKVKAIGISNCFAWQLAKANQYALDHNLHGFVSCQGHHNLIFREDEVEMKPYADIHNIALTPYSALAAGRLARKVGVESNRLNKDAYAKGKYDATKEVDEVIISRVEELANKYHTSMTSISIAWLLTKVTSPIVGASKVSHIDGMVEAMDIDLSDEDLKYLEETYVPHKLVGMMKKD